MSTEFPTTEATENSAPVPPHAPPTVKDEKRSKLKGSEGDAAEPVGRRKIDSPALRALQEKDNATVADIVAAISGEAGFRIAVHRQEPEFVKDPRTGARVSTHGHLKTYEGEAVDETFLAKHHGGGKYNLRFMVRDSNGRYTFLTSRIVSVAGEPNLDDPNLNRNDASPAPTSAPAVVTAVDPGTKLAVEVLQGELAHARKQPVGGESTAVVTMATKQLELTQTELRETRRELAEIRSAKPPEDPFKEKMLTRLMEDDSARLHAVRAQYESEIRVLKETHASEISRLRDDMARTEQRVRDQADRDRADAKASHERELALTKSSYETTIATLKSSHAVEIAAVTSTAETRKAVLEAENRRLERENADHRSDVKELRAIKEKGPLQSLKEINELKEALGIDEGDKGWADKFADLIANPGSLELVKEFMAGRNGGAAAQQAQQNPAQQQKPTERRVVKDKRTGQRFYLEPDGTLSGPIKVKKKTITAQAEAGGPEMPEIEEGKLQLLIGMMERAYQGNQDPEVVAQSFRAQIPEEILTTIRALGDQLGSVDRGIDAFMSKVAKLQSNSPLASQGGRNWIRKVGKSLVGE